MIGMLCSHDAHTTTGGGCCPLLLWPGETEEEKYSWDVSIIFKVSTRHHCNKIDFKLVCCFTGRMPNISYSAKSKRLAVGARSGLYLYFSLSLHTHTHYQSLTLLLYRSSRNIWSQTKQNTAVTGPHSSSNCPLILWRWEIASHLCVWWLQTKRVAGLYVLVFVSVSISKCNAYACVCVPNPKF